MATNKTDKVLNVPTLRFPGFTDEWQKYSLGEYFTFKNGLNPDAKRIGRGVKFISVMDILNNNVITYSLIRDSVEATEDEISTYGVKYGDILFQRSSETLEDVGHANVYLDDKAAVYGGFVIRGRAIKEYNPVFMKYALASPINRKRIIVKGAGAQHFNIGQDGLSKVQVMLPDSKEQNRIAALFALLDERIALQSKLIEDLKKLKSAIVEMLYVQSTSKIRLGAVIKQVSIRNRNGSDRKVMSVNNKYGFIAQSEQFEERLVASEDTSNYKVIVPGIFAYNPARINVGSIAQYNGDKPCVVSPMYICFECEEKVIGAYLEHFFSTKYFHKEMEKRLEGSVRLCLSFEALCNISISLPPKEQQQKYAQVVGRILEQISTETDILQAYQKQKSYLLSAMFI